MKLLFIFLLVLSVAAVPLSVLALREPRRPGPWSVEVLRTTDARGMTYSSLHAAQGEPDASGSVLRWTDKEGRRWLYVHGALAHELTPATE